MAAKKSYNRFFIIFQEEDRGFGMGVDKPPTGYAKIETKNDKGKVTVYVQNLKPFEEEGSLYKCYLISHHDNKDNLVYLGNINIDELGRGEVSFESPVEDAFNSKVSLDKFNAAAIVVGRPNMEKVIAPLAGYMSKEKFDWRSKIIIERSEAEAVKEEEARLEEADEETEKFEEYEKEITEIVENKKEVIVEKAEEVKEGVREETIPEDEGKEEVLETVSQEDARGDETQEIMESQDEDLDEDRHKKKGHKDHEEHKDGKKDECDEKHEHHQEECECKKENEKHEEHECHDHEEKEHKDHHQEYSCHEEHKEKDECDDESFDEYENKYYQKDFMSGYYSPNYNYNVNYYNMNPDIESYRRMMKKILEDILEDYEEMEKCRDIKDCKLWKIDMENCKKHGHMMYMYPFYDLVFYPVMYNPACNHYEYIKRHGHYLFGIKYGNKKEVKALMFGIPGGYNIYDQPFAGTTGFTKWIPWGKEGRGYWIMMYDPMTGMIMRDED